MRVKAQATIANRYVSTRQQRIDESRDAYVRAAARYARRTYNEISTRDEYSYGHDSFIVRDAMLTTEARFADLGTFGVEYIPEGRGRNSPAVDYLNAGDPYELTILYVRGQFRAGCWGDIVERGRYD